MPWLHALEKLLSVKFVKKKKKKCLSRGMRLGGGSTKRSIIGRPKVSLWSVSTGVSCGDLSNSTKQSIK